jgi:hypothetical protein
MLITYCPHCDRHQLGNIDHITGFEHTERGLVAIAPCAQGHQASTELAGSIEPAQLTLAS